MAIQALPDTTVRTLGATQALTDASSIVKELIDNSLDANATSISVEIHSNTLDFIQVRDNGHGIAPEDRPLVARRYCTSKITHDDELKDIGGTSLGFRGEALASAAELCGSLTISTRVEGEIVAAALTIDRKGEVIKQEKASLPVGTTVRIADFIKANPVRRQNALKNTEKCLKSIKGLLQAYAFARPNVRLSLRIAKSKKAVGDWVYAPKPGGNAEDAAFKIVGAACASQCTYSVIEERGLTFKAFLPRPDAELAKVSNIGYFISVDARPVSSSAGTFKQIVKIFREALKDTKPDFDGVRDPFLYLNIECPIGSYDVNVEPSKNDVLFDDNGRVIATAKKFFETVYPKAESAAPPNKQSNLEAPAQYEQSPQRDSMNVPTGSKAIDDAAFNDGSYRPPTYAANGPKPPTHREEEDDVTPAPKFRSTMYGYDEEDLELLNERPSTDRAEVEYEELRQARKDITASNPWITAKLNSTQRRPVVDVRPDLSSSPPKRMQPSHDTDVAALPTPRPSSPSPPVTETGMNASRAAMIANTPDLQMARQETAHIRQTGPNILPLGRDNRLTTREEAIPGAAGFHTPNQVPEMRHANHEERSNLPPPQFYTPMPSSAPRATTMGSNEAAAPLEAQAYNYELSSDQPTPALGTPLDAIPARGTRASLTPKQPLHGKVNKPFKPPLKAQEPREKVWFDHLEGIERHRGQRRNPPNRSRSGLVVQGEGNDESSRPLSPPQQNRDIREFVGPRHGESIAEMIERHNHHNQNRVSEDQREQENRSNDDQSQHPARHRVIGGRDFVPASDLAALEAYASSPEKPNRQPPKRRKTSERRPLRTMSANVAAADQNEEQIRPDDNEDPDYDPGKGNGARRPSSARPGRRRSTAKLPLERIPKGQEVQNLVLTEALLTQRISELVGRIDWDASLLYYNEPAIPLPSIFDSDQLDLKQLSHNLHNLLITVGSEGEGTGPSPVFNQLQAAFSRRGETASMDIDREEFDDDDDIMSNV